MAVRVTVQIINSWKIMIFLGLIICTVTLTAMCYLYSIIDDIIKETRCSMEYRRPINRQKLFLAANVIS